jgi:hypothetical protein
VERVGGFPTKKTGDKGIDGRMYFETKEGLKAMVLSVTDGRSRSERRAGDYAGHRDGRISVPARALEGCARSGIAGWTVRIWRNEIRPPAVPDREGNSRRKARVSYTDEDGFPHFVGAGLARSLGRTLIWSLSGLGLLSHQSAPPIDASNRINQRIIAEPTRLH